MTAATITPASLAEEARTVLHTALPLLGAMPVPAVLPAIAAAWDLDRALDGYEALASGRIHWAAVYDELSGEAEPDHEALRKAANEAAACAEKLVRAIAAHGGIQAMQALTGAGR